MAAPRLSDYITYVGRDFTNSDWDSNCQTTVNFLTAGTYAVDFSTMTADYIYGDVSGCTGFPTSQITAVAGENITIGDAVRLSSGQVYKCTTASDAGVDGFIGFAVATTTAGSTLYIEQIKYAGLSGLSTGSFYYLSTSGAITSSKPSSRAHLVGYALNTTTIIVSQGIQRDQTFSSANISNTFSVTGAVTFASTLGVTGATTISSLSATTGAFSSTLSVTGATTLAALSATTGAFSSTLGVTGASTFTGRAYANGGLSVNSTTTSHTAYIKGYVGIETNSNNVGIEFYDQYASGLYGFLYQNNGSGATGGRSMLMGFYSGSTQTIQITSSTIDGRHTYFNVTNSNFGIGTSSPAYKLHLSGAFYSDTSVSVGSTYFSNVALNVYGGEQIKTTGNNVGLEFLDTSNGLYASIYENNAGSRAILMSFYSGASKTIQITSSTIDGRHTYFNVANSNFGIGTSSPAYKLDVSGTFNVSGAATLGSTLSVTGAVTLSSTLGVTGNFAVNTNKFNITASSGETSIAGDVSIGATTILYSSGASLFSSLTTTGAGTIGGTLSATGDFAINTNKFVVIASNGNTTIAGTLTVDGSNGLSVTGANGIHSTYSISAGTYLAATTHVSATTYVSAGSYVLATTYLRSLGHLALTDGIAAPSTEAGYALIYVDSGDGDLKVKFGDGTVKTIVTDT